MGLGGGLIGVFVSACGLEWNLQAGAWMSRDRMKSAFPAFALIAVAAVTALNTSPAGSPAAAAHAAGVNYARPFDPPTRPAFLPLPPGAVEPQGWLRDWCLAARDGFTGHMDEYDDEFKRAWAPDHQMTGDGLLWYQGAWPYEGGGYWFDGLARLGFALHDPSLIQQAQRRLYCRGRPHEHQQPALSMVAGPEPSRRSESGHRRVGGLAALGLRPARARYGRILRRVR